MDMRNLPKRHAERHALACATLAPPRTFAKLRVVQHADGRRAYPDAVQYRPWVWEAATQSYVEYRDGPLLDLPPTVESHPDTFAEEVARRVNRPYRPTTLPYTVIVHDLALYDHLTAIGALAVGHRLPLDYEHRTVDGHSASGA